MAAQLGLEGEWYFDAEYTSEEKTEHEGFQMDGPSTNYREFILTLPPGGGVFTHSHWPSIDNPLVHFRANDRQIDGGRSLFLEEIQSDWIQQGRKARTRQVKALIKAGLSKEEAEVINSILKQYKLP